MKDTKTLDELISATEAKIAKLEEKRTDIESKIKASKTELEKLKMMKSSQQLSAFANALSDKGISMEEVMAALAAGDLLSLQEKIEQSNTSVAN